ncbi:MAG: hypothetical protein J5680_05795 [Neisseriaceae bacterium]|nr:hypothetical protein [Neisseriaceae bacterium]
MYVNNFRLPETIFCRYGGLKAHPISTCGAFGGLKTHPTALLFPFISSAYFVLVC